LDEFRIEKSYLTLEFNLQHWIAIVVIFDNKRPILNVLLNRWVVELTTNQAFGVENSVANILSSGCENLSVSTHDKFLWLKGDDRRCCSVAPLVRDDFDLIVVPDSDARVSGAEVDTNRRVCRINLNRVVCVWLHHLG
jgi:hypothetical protein